MEGVDDKKSPVFKVWHPDHPLLMHVIHAAEGSVDYRHVEDPASLPLPTDFIGLFGRKLGEYEGLYEEAQSVHKWYRYQDRVIARWDNRDKSIRLWLKNILQSDKYKDGIAALPANIKTRFKQRPRKPCPCGQQHCYANDRAERVFTYTYEGVQYEMCERRSFVFKGDDVNLVPVYLRMLEWEYGLKIG
jgi:hypothetical protein